MSMSQANAALIIDTYADTARLGITLTQAERMVDDSARRMGAKTEGAMGKMGMGIANKLAAAVGTGLAVKVVDDALRKVAEGIRESQGAAAIGEAIGNSIVESIRAVPVAGALMELSSAIGDQLLGGPMAREAAEKNAKLMMEAQAKAAANAPAAFRELQLMGQLGDAERAQIEREQFIARVDEVLARAKAGQVQMVNGVEQELMPGALARLSEARARAIQTKDAEIAEAARRREEAVQERRDARMKKLADDAQKAAEAREKMLKDEQEKITRSAIMGLESQLQTAEQAIAPTRAQRLAQIMAGLPMGIQTADTALGAFTFAAGDPAQISRNILETANKQLAALERIEGIQREIAALQKGTGFN